MDRRLVAWARAVKARRRKAGLPYAPPLWLFTDVRRLGDPLAIVARMPRGLCGVVFRDDSMSDRAALVKQLASVCRERRVWLSVAGDWRLAVSVQAGAHLRDGRGAGRPLTSSVHDITGLRRAARRGVQIVFVSPWRLTESHPSKSALGNVRWLLLAGRRGSLAVMALGGVTAELVMQIPRRADGMGAIGAWLSDVWRPRHSVSQLPCKRR